MVRAPQLFPVVFYWQASQVPPLSMAAMEQAFFSSAVKVEEVPSEQ